MHIKNSKIDIIQSFKPKVEGLLNFYFWQWIVSSCLNNRLILVIDPTIL